MAWGKSATNTLESSGDTLNATGLDKKFNMFLVHTISTTQSSNYDIQPALEYNGDSISTGSDIAHRYSSNGGADVSQSQRIYAHFCNGSQANMYNIFNVAFLINISTEEKLHIMFSIVGNADGATNIPLRSEEYGKKVLTNGLITEINIDNSNGTSDFATGSNITVFGTD